MSHQRCRWEVYRLDNRWGWGSWCLCTTDFVELWDLGVIRNGQFIDLNLKYCFRYISDPLEVSTYRAYRCLLKTTGGQEFHINLKPDVFKNFEKVQSALVKQTFGEAIMTPPFDHKLWTDLVTRQVFKLQSSNTMKHFRVARNIGLQVEYLIEKSLHTNGALRAEHIEVVYPDMGELWNYYTIVM